MTDNDWRTELVRELVYDASIGSVAYSVGTYYADGGARDDYDVVLFDDANRTIVALATFNADDVRYDDDELTNQTVGDWIGQTINAQTSD